ncbi:MAG: hypothetical protein CME71_09235 [Halobacteriovorax sp.]|nr:hypothetical protein [Halobacteriovorax sp.]
MLFKFIHPTPKSMIIAFFIAQLFPLLVLGLNQKLGYFIGWLQFELVILGALCLWEVKPTTELDERETEIMLRWKGRMLEVVSSLVIIPIIILSFKPEISGWTLFILTGVPMYVAFIVCTLLLKKELGYFFYTVNENG